MNDRLALLHLALLALTLLALILRVWSLGAFSVTHDEAYGLWIATRSLAPTGVLPAAARDVHPPLYYLLLHFWLALGPSKDVWARLPSVLLGVALVPALYALGRRLWNVRAGLVAALLAALSPLAVAQAREARMYPLAVLLLTLAAYALLRATKDDSRQTKSAPLCWWAAYTVLSVLALYTHYYAGFVLVAFTCYVLRVAYSMPHQTKHETRNTFYALLSALAIATLYLPWLPALADQFSRVRADFWIPPPSPEGVGKVAQTLSFFAITPRPPTATPVDLAVKVVGAACVAVALLVVCAASLLSGCINQPGGVEALAGNRLKARPEHVLRGSGWLPALWLAVPLLLAIAVSLVGPSVFEPRYFAVCLPAFVLLVARGVVALPGRVLKATLLTGLVIASLASLHTLTTFPAYRSPDTRSAAAWLRAYAAPADLVVHTSQVSLRPIVWYNGDDAAGVLIDDAVLQPGPGLAAASRVLLVVPYDVRLAAGPRRADATAAEWAAQHDLWDLRTVARFWGIHIYEWANG